ncbi:MAG: FAD-dependent oxidoreductase [Methylococcales bacterium]
MRFTTSGKIKQVRDYEGIRKNVHNLRIPLHPRNIERWADRVPARKDPVLLIIGAGPVGQRLAEELIRRDACFDIKVFGDEPHEPYNRVQLSSLLAGSALLSDLLNPISSVYRRTCVEYIDSRIRGIDPKNKFVTDQQGVQYPYRRLVLATGSRAFIPAIPGNRLDGVYTFRTLRDTEALCARRSRARQLVVVGGGLLGLEAACALARPSIEITLIQQGERLMNRQLDRAAAAELQRRVESKGIRIILRQGVRLIKGDQRVEAVTTRYGECIPCDTVVFCTGIETNVELALDSGIRIRRGIVIDDHLQTSAADIFAIGECSEHRAKVYGLVAPGLEQAAVLADRLTGVDTRYPGSKLVSHLKVVGEEVTSIGEVSDLTKRSTNKESVYTCKKTGDHRKLVLRHGRVISACGVGPWPESGRIQEALQNRRSIYPWQCWNFRRSGRLWNNAEYDDVRLWPDNAIVCQCNRVDRGTIGSAAASGCDTLESVKTKTGTGGTCGTCLPLLRALLQPGSTLPFSKTATALAVFSVLSVLAVGFIWALPALKPPISVTAFQYQFTWTDSLWKQITGFSILGLTLIGLAMSLQKRCHWKLKGEFEHWRLVHAILGCLALVVLFLHTGATLGVNLNRLLMVDYLSIAGIGALTGGVVSWANKTGSVKGPGLRRYWVWIHVSIAWPLPVLLSLHILTVYYF